ncbi:PPOX class probable F420-dependent enzyme [Saccharopolyspora erythraea NRRL 2338]|uniref:Pyridoxamine 5'-phosphate oxidase-related,FMN-binding n=2 Tax=Saccharopolyspora erythraea TaxID=1836 RepID=A4F5Z0_SACEN|nr:PPOX class F420-dependent oxidoreductase [Saccharopolyspora erythraea]EQD83996.1 pyridoxamine 5'-phosphate oxidase [Saccharopolyspora erythraea D]PFG93263.1 PPOX class probable F420-dependent enzyme [Saccharopolyspora erythraea NRRL 2338]QRK90114.1 PPOX class F420-dependent oxidoreductase [Saccharopolyspora erythraea]CAL99464.1 pyridoxamine 5'-phosphate oxidase-related,FMN-binding [Saccharopolyspora erythraea NRRL 2338]
MDLEEAVAVVRQQHRAVLSTLRADGTPQMSPVLATTDDAGHVTVSTSEKSAKVRNLRRDPRAWLCVLPDEFFGRWVQVEGDVEIVELPDAMPLLEEYFRSISGEHDDWEQYRAAMRDEGRVLLRVTPTRAVSAPTG